MQNEPDISTAVKAEKIDWIYKFNLKIKIRFYLTD